MSRLPPGHCWKWKAALLTGNKTTSAFDEKSLILDSLILLGTPALPEEWVSYIFGLTDYSTGRESGYP